MYYAYIAPIVSHVQKRLLERPRFELAAKGVGLFRLGRCGYIFWHAGTSRSPRASKWESTAIDVVVYIALGGKKAPSSVSLH